MEYLRTCQQQMRSSVLKQTHQAHRAPIHQHRKENQQYTRHFVIFLSEKIELAFQLMRSLMSRMSPPEPLAKNHYQYQLKD